MQWAGPLPCAARGVSSEPDGGQKRPHAAPAASSRGTRSRHAVTPHQRKLWTNCGHSRSGLRIRSWVPGRRWWICRLRIRLQLILSPMPNSSSTTCSRTARAPVKDTIHRASAQGRSAAFLSSHPAHEDRCRSRRDCRLTTHVRRHRWSSVRRSPDLPRR